ncbi:MAG: ATP-binding protein [Methanosarcinaceae archaeon]
MSKIENVSAFNKLVQLLSYQIGSLVNRNELTSTLGIHYRTLSKYLDVLIGTFIYAFVNPFYTNVRKELSKMPKVFLNDTGIYYYYNPQKSLTFDSIPGNIVENYVYTTLTRRKAINSINFYRTIAKSEIDFIIKKWEKIIPIEVKFRKAVKAPAVLNRFQKRFNTEKPIVITKDLLLDSNEAYFIPVTLLDLIEL